MVVFHFPNNWGRLLFSKKLRSSSIGKQLRSSSICPNIEVVFHFLKIEVVFHFRKIEVVIHFPKDWDRLPFSKKNEVVFHIQNNWGRLPIWALLHSCMVTLSSFANFQLFHYYSGRAAGLLCKMKIRLTQPSLAGTWAELGKISLS
jgi:hypothetical protein